MKFIVLSLFPEMINALFNNGIVKRAVEKKIISADAINIRDFAKGKHKNTDARPYGGGCGMVMKPEPISDAIDACKKKLPKSKTVLMTPQGKQFDHNMANCFASSYKDLIFICGRYEGIDERVCEKYVDFEISIGDFILTGGELAAMVVIDAVTRLIPGVLGCAESALKESFCNGLLEYPQYTRPASYKGDDVPNILLSGNHKEIEKWRLETSLIKSFLKRPDLLIKKKLTDQEKDVLRKWCYNIEKTVK
jgi:tRNA (guanine37-N1)-methyltransferase